MSTATATFDKKESTNVMSYTTFLTYVGVKNGGNYSATAEQVVAVLKENWSNLSANGLNDKTVVEYVAKWCEGDQIDRGRIGTHQECVEALRAGGFSVPESFVMPYTTFLTMLAQMPGVSTSTPKSVVAYLKELAERQEKANENMTAIGLNNKTIVDYVCKFFNGDQFIDGPICSRQECEKALRAAGFI